MHKHCFRRDRALGRPLALPILALACRTVFAQTPEAPSEPESLPEQREFQQPLSAVLISEPLAEFRQFEKIEITGSSIVRREQKTALPVQIITRDDIKRSGYTQLQALIQNLPVMSNYNEASQFDYGAFYSASIHGMQRGTLLLLNGKRLAPYGQQEIAFYEQTSADLAMVPLAAVDRIEILTDGASSLYGTDAIAGVVNIITRTDRKGFEISAENAQPDGKRGAGQNLSLSWGTGQLTREGFNLQFNAQWSRRDPLVGGDRPELGQGYRQFSDQGQTYTTYAPLLSEFNSPATLLGINFRSREIAEWNSAYQNGGCVGAPPIPGQPACQHNPYWQYSIYPKREDIRVHGLGELAIPGGAIAYGEVLFFSAKDAMGARLWPYDSFRIGPNKSYPGYQEARNQNFYPGYVYALWTPGNLPPLGIEFAQQNWRTAVGIKGEWSGWDYHFNAYQSQSRSDYSREVFDDEGYAQLRKSWVDAKGFLINPDILQPVTPASTLGRALLSLVTTPKYNHGIYATTAAELRASRTAFELDGREAKLGLGIELRREATEQINDDVRSEVPTFSNSRSILAAYSEIQLPVTTNWELTGAVRHDEYSQIGRTTNGKLSSRFQPHETLMIRASAGTGFRAPTLGQSARLATPYLYGYEEISKCTPELIAIAASLHDRAGNAGVCDTALPVLERGNTALKPETSSQVSAGFRWTPVANTSLSIDYWSIRIRDMLQTMPLGPIFGDPIRYRDFFSLYSDPSIANQPGQLALAIPAVNTGGIRRDGVDFDLRLRHPTELGQLLFSATGTWTTKSQFRLTDDSELVSDLGRYSSESRSVSPRLKGRLEVGLRNPSWHTSLGLNYVAGYRDIPFTATNAGTGQIESINDQRVKAWTTYDLTGSYLFTNNLELRASILNLANKAPPFTMVNLSPTVFGFNASMANAWGRVISGQIILRF